MSRRAVLGRAALSFNTADGILDIDQIMETDPWKHIDDFVQQNFMQDILNQFDERMKLEPKPVPAEAKKPRKSPDTRSNRTNRENLSNKTNSPMANNENSARSGGTLPETRKQAFGLRGKRVNDTETKEKKRNSVPKKQRLVRRRRTVTSKKSQQLENVTKSSVEEDFTAKRSTKKRTENENVADMSICKTECANPMEIATENVEIDGNVTSKHQTTIETLKNASSCSTFKASTPERFVDAVSNNSTEPFEFPITKKPNVDQSRSLHKEHRKKETSAKCKCDTTVELKNCVEKREGEKVKEVVKKESGQKNGKKRSNKSEKVSKRKKHNGKTETTDGKQIGKFEKRLLKKEKKRRDRQIYREERKAQRAIEKFSHHVTNIAEKMGYLQKCRSNTRASKTNDSSDFSEESSYTSSSYDSSTSCSCSCSSSSCSCTSCSCSYDLSDCSFSDNSYGTDEYSEYTLCSCSGCDSSCSSG
ncbi:uncharacterized protein LOC122402191 [Colletes gigas]|uniref:uncharacterized protein LOC122402191 n=1 Tax=Colletes gigas TaxID=935657 RepID=UPI001C9B9970|nr:uncharacterized protein LOC122402191 [Colletes gigas]